MSMPQQTMEYGAYIRATVPYEALAQQRYPRAYSNPHAPYPSYAMDARHYLTMNQLHQQRQHHVAMMGGEDPHRGQPRQNDPKPRLAKDEVELLEREFAKNPKPNSSTKRDLAERMAVDVARINNWFQNRRAKAKLQAKEQEAQERSLAGDAESADDAEGSSSETTGAEDDKQAAATASTTPASASTLPPLDVQANQSLPEDVQQLTKTEQTASESTMLAQPAVMSADLIFDSITSSEPMIPILSHSAVSTSIDLSSYLAIDAGSDSMDTGHTDTAEHLESLVGGSPFFEHEPPSEFEMHAAATFPSEYLPSTAMEEPMLIPTSEQAIHGLPQSSDIAVGDMKAEIQLSPVSLSLSPPTSVDLRFKSPPPPSNLAIRRNIRRPSALHLSSSTSPMIGPGPKTCIDPIRPSPMRRAASATGTLSGRIHKPMSAMGPRSPFSRDNFLQNLQRTQSPVLESLSGHASPRLTEMPTRETTVSSCTSDEDGLYMLNSAAHIQIAEHAISTPPVTPGFHATHFEPVFPYGATGAMAFPRDDSCLTPGLISNGSEFELSLPGPSAYACASQPVTPSFPGHHSLAHNLWAPLGGNPGPGALEYNFPESYAEMAPGRTSPGPAKAKQFQFTQNVTPQDFHIPK